jgi:hypothetical protein
LVHWLVLSRSPDCAEGFNVVKALRNSASAASATMAHGPQASLFDAAGLLVRSRSGNELGEGPITVKPTLTETNGSVQC